MLKHMTYSGGRFIGASALPRKGLRAPHYGVCSSIVFFQVASGLILLNHSTRCLVFIL